MKIKKPSLKGMKNTEYLGRFQKDEFIQQGHNFMSGQMKGALARAMASQVSGKMQNPNMPAPEAAAQQAAPQAPQAPMGGGMLGAARRALGAGQPSLQAPRGGGMLGAVRAAIAGGQAPQAPQGQVRPMLGRVGRMFGGKRR